MSLVVADGNSSNSQAGHRFPMGAVHCYRCNGRACASGQMADNIMGTINKS